MGAAALVLVALLAACSGGSDAGDPATPPAADGSTSTTPVDGARADDEQEVRAAFAAYRDALLAEDGAAAAGRVSGESVAYFDEMRSLAYNGDRASIGGRPMIDRLFVTITRLRVPRSELEALSGEGLLVFGVENGLIGADTVANIELGEIVIADDTATAAVVNRGQPTPGRFRFVRESGGWRVDLVFLLRAADAALRQAAVAKGQDQNELIFEQVAMTTGQPVSAEIWDPPGS